MDVGYMLGTGMDVGMFDCHTSACLTTNCARLNKPQSNLRRFVVESALQRGVTLTEQRLALRHVGAVQHRPWSSARAMALARNPESGSRPGVMLLVSTGG